MPSAFTRYVPILLLGLLVWSRAMSAAAAPLLLDDRSSGNLCANTGACWRLVTDGVMGGVSDGRLQPAQIEGRSCLRLTGEVSTLNNGGFIQASLDLDNAGWLDARGGLHPYRGIEIDVYGNAETYNLHLRTADTRIVWQSYRASFQASPRWHTVRLPFAELQPHRIEKPLDLSRLRRLGLVAIGREMQADLCFTRVTFYP